jgi:cell division septum initiation protein DivIVA
VIGMLRAAYFAKYVSDVEFRRTLFGYRPDEVHRHLEAVKGWFVLSGIEEPLQQRISELEGDAERRRRDAEAEAARILDEARREAAQIRWNAREEADALLAEARHEAALERRGRSRVGRPVGDGESLARSERFVRH